MFPKKLYPFDQLSPHHRCKVCGKGIKLRLVQQKQVPPTLCYRHWKETRTLAAPKVE